MTLVLNDPSFWPVIKAWRVYSYFAVAASVGVTYDWALSFGQEVELIWKQRWSLMTVLYLSVRYLGILYIVVNILSNVPTIFVTDAGCRILYFVWSWMSVVVVPILSVIMITQLHAMYRRSRNILVFLVVTFLANNIFNAVTAVMLARNTSGEEFILSGTHVCTISIAEATPLLYSITWILGAAWAALLLCLGGWIAVKHFRALRQHSAEGIIRDCFMVLITSHMLYVASFVVVSCFGIISDWSPTIIGDSFSLQTQIYFGFVQIFQIVQTFVLGPRLILGIREYHAKLVADSDAATRMTTIVFQERVHISTGSGVECSTGDA